MLQSFVRSLLLVATSTAICTAQPTISSLQPRTAAPGATTTWLLKGDKLTEGLRAYSSHADATFKVERVDDTTAHLQVTLPDDVPCGPAGLWLVTNDGISDPITWLVDDLHTIASDDHNHSTNSAQSLELPVAVDGQCDAAAEDVFRFSGTAGEWLSVDTFAQRLDANTDMVVRLTDSNGNTIQIADDDTVGPDSRFRTQLPASGEYFLFVRDSRYQGGGNYHLRLGDLPVASHLYPLAVMRGTSTQIETQGIGGTVIAGTSVSVSKTTLDEVVHVSARDDSSGTSHWGELLVRNEPQYKEEDVRSPDSGGAPKALRLPFGMSGRLNEAKQVDRYHIAGNQGVAIRVISRTRSLGLPTVLRMTLKDADGSVVAETAVNDSDEWSFDYTFPDDGVYALDVSDLLRRGGTGFDYWLAVTPIEPFAVSLKADAAVRERFLVEPQSGATPVDLQVQRNGYKGPITIDTQSSRHVRILNPVIPDGADAARIYLVADTGWSKDSLAMVRLTARGDTSADGSPKLVTSQALHRAKAAHVPFPAAWKDGWIVLAGVPQSTTFFGLEPAAPLQFARNVDQHLATFTLKRLKEEFKAGVEIISGGHDTSWSVAAKTDGDTYALTCRPTDRPTDKSAEASNGLPAELAMTAYAEFQGRGRIERISAPIGWIDPLLVTIQPPDRLLAGRTTKVTVEVERNGNDRQPIQLKPTALAGGFTLPESMEIAADATTATFELLVDRDIGTQDASLTMLATSSYGGQSYEVSSNTITLEVLPPPGQFKVFPPEIRLTSGRDRQQLVVTGTGSEGHLRDWTRDALILSSNEDIVSINGTTVVPRGNGSAEITVEYRGVATRIPVQVENADVHRPVQFENEVLVALSKQGCNSGACHGSPSGKGAFRLSLRAFDQQLDQLTLIREDFGRRVNTLAPEQSLLLLKPTMKVTHGGGKQLHLDNEAYDILKAWIAEGARSDPAGTSRCVRLEIYPDSKRILMAEGGPQQLAAIAHFDDGSHRDVTHLAVYQSSNTDVATVDASGLVTTRGRGETAILVRFLEHIESLPLMFIEDVPGFRWQSPPANNYVDQRVFEKLQQLQYLPAETCTDSEFVRRVCLDVIGVLPTVAETEAFLQDPSQDKRGQLIDQLLERREHAKFWALKWGDVLKMTSKIVGDEAVYKYHLWVEEAIRQNMPYDKFVRELVTGSGSTLANPPANFYRAAGDMNDCVETISQVFMGARLQCAKCHNHPFERWTQDNYYGLGAFFNRVQRRKTQRPGETFVWYSATGDVTQPRTGQLMQPWLPSQGTASIEEEADRRTAFADWLLQPDNPYFARVEVNRIWSQLFARGIVDPIDDFRDSNPPSNDALLQSLADDFVASGFDRKHILRTILNSRTYQASYLTNEFNEQDSLYASHQQPRLLIAEQLLDAINHVTGTEQTFAGLPPTTKATQLPAPDVAKVDFLKVFGQPERSTNCACERVDDSNLGMAIELFNGATIHDKLRASDNRFRKALAAGKSVAEAIRELYLAAVCREPAENELTIAVRHCEGRDDPASGLEDVCWALLNTDEFLFQH